MRVKVRSDSISNLVKGHQLVVKRGSHIQMECPLQANPSPDYVEWTHNVGQNYFFQ